MRKAKMRVLSVLMAFIMLIGLVPASVKAAPVSDEAVQAVIEQLEAIDTLAQMQAKRSTFTVSSAYNASNPDSVAEHLAAQNGYENYVTLMFSARQAAQAAYDALTDEQKAQIDASLVAKLEDELDTVWTFGTYATTPAEDEYTFQAGFPGHLVYEMSGQIVATGDMPAIIPIVDVVENAGSWTPDGPYSYGENNYELTYCCDLIEPVEEGILYKRMNLEDSDYFGDACARHIRAIVQNAYPFVTIDEMKQTLIEGGLDSDLVNQLTKSDIIEAVQVAIWIYANMDAPTYEDAVAYGGTMTMTRNGIFRLIHDYSNEQWEYWSDNRKRPTYDAETAYRVNNLIYYLVNLEEVESTAEQVVITDVDMVRAELIAGTDDIYKVGMYVLLEGNVSGSDDLKIHVTSYTENEDGTRNITAANSYGVDGSTKYGITTKARYGDTIEVVVEGTQDLPKGVYYYVPQGGREASQTLVGVSEGATSVRVMEEFVFQKDIEMGLRIYKTESGSGRPLSEITFHVYQVEAEDGKSFDELPTAEDIEKYVTEANLVGSVITDNTGYAALPLEEGFYIVVEEHNEEKVKEPVAPFWLQIPMAVPKDDASADSGTEIELDYVEIVSVYPKNEPIEPPDNPPPPVPPPGDVNGKFTIVKHDSEDADVLLGGAKFQVYEPADESDENTKTIRCEGIDYLVTPVMIDGEELILTTGEDGTAISPNLPCQLYFLAEIEAPVGYYLKGEVTIVNVIADTVEGVKTFYIANEKAGVLPETGGIGTMAFYVGGSVLVLGAGVVLISRRRMRSFE